MKIIVKEQASRETLVEIPDNTPLEEIRELALQTVFTNKEHLDPWEIETDCTEVWRPATPQEIERSFMMVDGKPFIEHM